MRALGQNLLTATCVVGLTVVTPAPTKSQASSLSLWAWAKSNPGVMKEVGYRYWRYRHARPNWRNRYAHPSFYDRRYQRRFGVGPGRYFGVGPGAYECYGYDCNW